jgi:hypothetical protein
MNRPVIVIRKTRSGGGGGLGVPMNDRLGKGLDDEGVNSNAVQFVWDALLHTDRDLMVDPSTLSDLRCSPFMKAST